MTSTNITDLDFEKFRDFFYGKTGIQFDTSKRYFVDKRLVERILFTKSDSFRAYFTMLRFEASGEELQHLTNLMTVNETYFFREEYQFQCLVNSMLPDICSRKHRMDPIRIWVIPCSSGEETYSIALYLLEYWDGIHNRDVEIVSSDIDTKILAQAQRGLYSERSVQNLPEKLRRKYFQRTLEGYQISGELRSAVEFTRVNLSDSQDTRDYQDFDVIFCRNLLIYFDDTSRKTAVDTFFRALNPGGYICLGHSESIGRVSMRYEARKFPEAIVYQRPLETR